ncbi:hypothetical protein ABZ471_47995 [Streptomyces sp. NPDC005728]|uniref:hypothetical protein n=1 Tax=Streptomyces sp. NPDC005728 TaxID=3157054 RepID=UPI0033FF4547
MRQQADDRFAAQVEKWSRADWDEYGDRIAIGESSVATIDAINRRRRRGTITAVAEADR